MSKIEASGSLVWCGEKLLGFSVSAGYQAEAEWLCMEFQDLYKSNKTNIIGLEEEKLTIFGRKVKVSFKITPKQAAELLRLLTEDEDKLGVYEQRSMQPNFALISEEINSVSGPIKQTELAIID